MLALMAAIPVPRLQLLAAAALFSTGGAAIKATALSGLQVAGLRSGLAAFALFVLISDWRRFWEPRALLVGIAYAATLVLYVAANKLTTAANTIFLQSTAPLYVFLLGPLLLAERADRTDLAVSVLLALGIACFFLGAEPPVRTAPDPALGNLLAALAGGAWALTLLGLRWLAREEEPGEPAASAGRAVVAGNALAFLFCLPWIFPLEGATPLDMLVVGYLGLFQIGLAYLFMTRGMRRVPALEAALILLLEPVLNSLLAWAVHGERPGTWSLLGCSIIFLGTLARTLIGRGTSPRATIQELQ